MKICDSTGCEIQSRKYCRHNRVWQRYLSVNDQVLKKGEELSNMKSCLKNDRINAHVKHLTQIKDMQFFRKFYSQGINDSNYNIVIFQGTSMWLLWLEKSPICFFSIGSWYNHAKMSTLKKFNCK